MNSNISPCLLITCERSGQDNGASISNNAGSLLANEKYPRKFQPNTSAEVASVKFHPAPLCLTSKVFGSQAEDKEI